MNPDDPAAKPYAVDRAVIQTAPGWVFDDEAIPQCNASDAELIAQGDAACPPGSEVQTGTVELDTGSPFPFPPRQVSVRTVTYNADGGLVSLAEGQSPPTRTVGRTKIDGETVTVEYPDFPGGPPDNQSAMKYMVTSGPATVGAGGRPHMRAPAYCPPSGRWVTRFRFIYHDGAEQTAAPETPCRPSTGCLGARQRVTRAGIGPVRLGMRRQALIANPARLPRRSRRMLAFCVVESGGEVRAVFQRSDAVLVMTTSPGHAGGKIAPGSSAHRFARAYPDRRRLARGIYRAGPRARLIVGLRERRVHFVGAATPGLLRNRAALVRLVRESG